MNFCSRMNNEIINHAKFFLMEFFRIHIFMIFSKKYACSDPAKEGTWANFISIE